MTDSELQTLLAIEAQAHALQATIGALLRSAKLDDIPTIETPPVAPENGRAVFGRRPLPEKVND